MAILNNRANDDALIRTSSTASPSSTASSLQQFTVGLDNSGPVSRIDAISNERGNVDEAGIAQPPQGRPGDPPYENETFIDFAQNGTNSKVSGRVKNPLSYLATYTYQLSLYLISPAAYEGFIASGRKNITLFNQADAGDNKAGAYLLAQGGGVADNNSRAPGFEFDYFMDKLNMETILPAKSESGNSVSINYKFSITEPYGFSFVSKLARAQQAILDDSSYGFSEEAKEEMKQPHNTTRNFFVLGIRFFGWDENGKQMMGSELTPDGRPLDPGASGTGALFESFQEVVFTSFKFKIDGRSTVYNIEAQPTGLNGAINVRKGMVPASGKEVHGTTVRDMLVGEKGLLTLLNKEQKDLQEAGSIERATVYKVRWQGADEIANASIITDNIENKNVQAKSDTKNTTEANAAAELSATPNKNIRRLTIPSVPIVQAIEQIIGSSRYIQDALERNFTDEETVSDNNSPDSKKGTEKELKWFNISPELSNIKWDNKRKDWVYDITYIIQPYLIPNVPAPYVNRTTDYYGPHKRYDYWYTGKNTEILSYEQVINNNYFLATLASDGTAIDKVSSPVSPNTASGGDKTGAQGTSSYASLNAFRTSLVDPSSFVKAKIQVLGDPDYLFSSTASSLKIDKFYDATGKIDATTNQVFMEVDFKEAYDYNTKRSDLSLTADGQKGGVFGQPGVMALNDSIEFWNYEQDNTREKVQGVSYQILQVKSNFTGGNFTQYIEAVINPFIATDAANGEDEQRPENEEQRTDDGGTA